MNSRIVLLNLFSAFLLLALVYAASAQTRTVGVSIGNTFTYSAAASWSSNDPNATPPSDLVEFNNTQWLEVNVIGISGTNVTVQGTTHYKNGTEATNENGWVDVNTGAGNMTMFVISANLAAGDAVYNSSQFSLVINETVPRTYLGGVRDTNHANTNYSSGVTSSRFNYYWDKSTGIFTDVLYEETDQTGIYTTTWSKSLQIISSNVWAVPEFPSWTPALLMLIAFTSATMVIARQRRPR